MPSLNFFLRRQASRMVNYEVKCGYDEYLVTLRDVALLLYMELSDTTFSSNSNSDWDG